MRLLSRNSKVVATKPRTATGREAHRATISTSLSKATVKATTATTSANKLQDRPLVRMVKMWVKILLMILMLVKSLLAKGRTSKSETATKRVAQETTTPKA